MPPIHQTVAVGPAKGPGDPLTLDDLAELLARAEAAGIPRTAELVARLRIRGQRVLRLEVTST